MASLTAAELAGLIRTELGTEEGLEIRPLPGGALLVKETAGEPSMAAAGALRLLAAVTRGRTRAVAVIGELDAADGADEPGAAAAEAHDRIGRLAVRLNIDRLVVVGEPARAMHLGAQHEGSWGSEAGFVETEAAAYDAVRALLLPGDVVLVKSSRAADLRRLGECLAEAPADGPAEAGGREGGDA